jgi:hypothetical protein
VLVVTQVARYAFRVVLRTALGVATVTRPDALGQAGHALTGGEGISRISHRGDRSVEFFHAGKRCGVASELLSAAR